MEALPTYLESFWHSGGGTMGISILVMLSVSDMSRSQLDFAHTMC